MTLFVLVLVGGLAFYTIVRPLWLYSRQPWTFEAPDGDAERTQQEQISALEALRDLAMDYRMGQLSATDYRALAAPLQQQARQSAVQNHPKVLTEADYRFDEPLEAEILALRRIKPVTNGHHTTGSSRGHVRFCAQCGEPVDSTDRFCAACGTKLPERQPSAETGSATAIPTEPLAEGTATVEQTAEERAETAAAATVEETAKAEKATAVAAATEDQRGAETTVRAFNRVAYRWWALAVLIVLVWVGGITWLSWQSRAEQTAQSPVATLQVGAIQALAITDDSWIVGTAEGLQSSQNGEEWRTLAVDDSIHAVALLAADRLLAAGSDGLWQRAASDDAWQPVATEPADLQLITLAAVPDEEGIVWGSDRTTLYVSHDGGLRWEVASNSLPGIPRSLAAGNGELLIGTDRGVYLSRNRGESWVDFNGAVNGRIGTTDVLAVAYDPAGNVIFAGTEMGLFFMNLASPGGWGRRALEANVTALAVTGEVDEVLWVGTADGMLFRSTNRGVSWQ